MEKPKKKLYNLLRSGIFLGAGGVFFAAQTVFAAPSISGISGTLSEGQTVTVSGSSFGTKSPVAPVLWDTVDNQAAYAALSSGAAIPVGSGYPWKDNSLGYNLVKYNIGSGFQGSRSYTANGNGEATLGDLLLGSYTQNFYLSWKFKPMNSFTAGDHSTKFHRITDSAADETRVLVWDQMHHFFFWNSSYCAGDWATWSGNVGAWNNMETVISPSNYELRVNGSSLAKINIGACGSALVDKIWKLGLEGGGNTPPSVQWYMDNIYVDKTLMRIEICSGSAWNSRGNCEVQIPTTTWNNTQVQFTVNQGSFAESAAAYLYMVDSSGTANASGYPVTFGSSQGGPSELFTISDFLQLVSDWLTSASTSDKNSDGLVNARDLGIIMSGWE